MMLLSLCAGTEYVFEQMGLISLNSLSLTSHLGGTSVDMSILCVPHLPTNVNCDVNDVGM